LNVVRILCQTWIGAGRWSKDLFIAQESCPRVLVILRRCVEEVVGWALLLSEHLKSFLMILFFKDLYHAQIVLRSARGMLFLDIMVSEAILILKLIIYHLYISNITTSNLLLALGDLYLMIIVLSLIFAERRGLGILVLGIAIVHRGVRDVL
jgi:hypothetical protein